MPENIVQCGGPCPRGTVNFRRLKSALHRAGQPIIGGMPEQEPTRRSPRRHWNWLLLIPLLLLVFPGLYSRSTPELFGFPFFYWYQFAAVIAAALLTGAVYLLTRNRADG